MNKVLILGEPKSGKSRFLWDIAHSDHSMKTIVISENTTGYINRILQTLGIDANEEHPKLDIYNHVFFQENFEEEMNKIKEKINQIQEPINVFLDLNIYFVYCHPFQECKNILNIYFTSLPRKDVNMFNLTYYDTIHIIKKGI